jgi:toxin YhaV
MIIEQLLKLDRAAQKALPDNPGNANVKLFNMVSRLIYETIPMDPAGREFRQGKTLGSSYIHWRRAKFGGRFRLFFRYDSTKQIIAFAWVNDDHNLRKAGSKSDPYIVFKGMLDSGNPPDDFSNLINACEADWCKDPSD